MEDREPSQNPESNQKQQEESKRSSFDTVQNFLNKIGKVRNKAQSSEQIIEELGKNVVSHIVSPQKKFIIIGGIILFFIIVFIIVFGKGGGTGNNFSIGNEESRPETPPPGDGTDPGFIPIPGLELTVDEPPQTTIGQPIDLVIHVEDRQSLDIEILASIPSGYKLLEVKRGVYSQQGDLIVWPLSLNTPEEQSDAIIKRYTFILTIAGLPEATDINNYSISARYATNQNIY